MNGAESLVATLVDQGVDICFANPGTSEMHFLAALGDNPEMRCVLGLFEGVCTGAADGWYRMTDRPASTLLHLGPGLANGLANIHNARRASSGMVNVVGEHSTSHLQYDPPLKSDIQGLAETTKPLGAAKRHGGLHRARYRRCGGGSGGPSRTDCDPDPARGLFVARRGGGANPGARHAGQKGS